MKKSKKFFAILICVMIMLLPFTVTAGAYNEQDGFLYDFIEGSNVIEILGISPNGKWAGQQNIELPYSLRGVSVVQIGKSAFNNDSTIQTIRMTENILQISDDAMYNMKSLKTITLPKHLTLLGKKVFSYCTALETVNFETIKLRQLSEFTFYGCTKLNNVILPASLLEIEDYCFGHCMSLDKIYIPSSVKNISPTAFYSTNSDLTIYGEAGTKAYRYAMENNINFVDVGEKELYTLYQLMDTVENWYNSIDTALYTEESINALETAYENAAATAGEFFSTPEEVSTAQNELDNAYHTVKLKSMETLETVIANAETFLPLFYRYTEATFNALQETLTQAEEIQNMAFPNDDEVKAVTENLNDRINALQELIKYDTNDDGKITLADIVLTHKRLAEDHYFTEREIYTADFNDDNRISLADITLFQRYLLQT